MAETRSPRNVTLIIGYINGSEKAGSGPVMPISNSFRGSTTESSSSPCYSVEINCATRAHSNNEQGGKSARKRSKTSRIISLQPWLPRRRLSTRCSFSRGTQKKKKKRRKKADLFPKPVISLSRSLPSGARKRHTGPRRERRCFHEDVVEDGTREALHEPNWLVECKKERWKEDIQRVNIVGYKRIGRNSGRVAASF